MASQPHVVFRESIRQCDRHDLLGNGRADRGLGDTKVIRALKVQPASGLATEIAFQPKGCISRDPARSLGDRNETRVGNMQSQRHSAQADAYRPDVILDQDLARGDWAHTVLEHDSLRYCSGFAKRVQEQTFDGLPGKFVVPHTNKSTAKYGYRYK